MKIEDLLKIQFEIDALNDLYEMYDENYDIALLKNIKNYVNQK